MHVIVCVCMFIYLSGIHTHACSVVYAYGISNFRPVIKTSMVTAVDLKNIANVH